MDLTKQPQLSINLAHDLHICSEQTEGVRWRMVICKKWNYSDFGAAINGRFQLGGWMRPNMSRSAQFLWSASSLGSWCTGFGRKQRRLVKATRWNRRCSGKCRRAFQSWMGFSGERKIKSLSIRDKEIYIWKEQRLEINATLPSPLEKQKVNDYNLETAIIVLAAHYFLLTSQKKLNVGNFPKIFLQQDKS